jgi:demethylmenaquinone methyltransferase/2-methoxy-6-polyprenyl-1,4-benzoquinol methylase
VTQDSSSASAGEPVWTDDRLKNPHAVADKQRRVRDMFAAIAPRYDLNNRLHSLGTDQRWRKKAVKLSRLKPEDVIVDVACGTGDLTLVWFGALWEALNVTLDLKYRSREWPFAAQVVGIDYVHEMIAIAKGKGLPWKGGSDFQREARAAEQRIIYAQGDAQNLPLPDACCDVVSIAFGIRNVADPMRALREFRRILRPGGRLVVLEFSRPTNPVIRRLYDFYCNQVMTRTAAWIARDRTGAYRYLSASVETFKTREEMKADIESAGFRDVEVHPLTFGVAVVYVGFVPRRG